MMGKVSLIQLFNMKYFLKSAANAFMTSKIVVNWKIMMVSALSILFSINILSLSIFCNETFGPYGIGKLTDLLNHNNTALKMLLILWLPCILISIILFLIYRKQLIKNKILKVSKIPFVIYFFISWILYLSIVLYFS